MTDQVRMVAADDTVLVVLPHSEVCRHMEVAGHLRRIRVLADSAQILNNDGSPLSFPVTLGEAGVYSDARGLWVSPMPSVLYQVTRDGAPVQSPRAPVGTLFGDAGAAEGWLLRHQPQSVDLAMRDEGYWVREVRPGSEQWPTFLVAAEDETPD